ncbi:MAG: phage tail tape measure protein, partial [Proteobacteria bacterium]|nr:phage tail tape measure protein [Pseudomonadota bacterium]
MAKAFNLTAEINLRGPSNLKPVISKIKGAFSSLTADVKINVDASSAKNMAAVSSKLNLVSKASNKANASFKTLNSTISTLSASFGQLSNSMSSAFGAIGGGSQQLTKAKKELVEVTSEIQYFGQQSGQAIRRFAAFSTVTAIIYGLNNAINDAFGEFISFNKQLVKLSQVTGKSLNDLGGLTDEITRLSTSLGVSSTELIGVASTLAQAGFTASDTRKALEALAKSSLAPSFENITETTEGAIAILRQFGLGAEDLESALGSINAVAAAFAVESQDLVSAIQRTGGVFANASKGVSNGTDALNEFLAIFTSIRATTRESAETIATGLRTIFTRLQRSRTIDLLKELGINLTDLEGKFVGPYKAVQLLSEGLSQLDPRDIRFSQIVEELGGFRQIGK